MTPCLPNTRTSSGPPFLVNFHLSISGPGLSGSRRWSFRSRREVHCPSRSRCRRWGVVHPKPDVTGCVEKENRHKVDRKKKPNISLFLIRSRTTASNVSSRVPCLRRFECWSVSTRVERDSRSRPGSETPTGTGRSHRQSGRTSSTGVPPSEDTEDIDSVEPTPGPLRVESGFWYNSPT